jgi:hypothetical protein
MARHSQAAELSFIISVISINAYNYLKAAAKLPIPAGGFISCFGKSYPWLRLG